ncbi:MAG: hypothetical protein E7600_08700 [Ruminococcaceae bacterium]|nr:hypothetical protein [Oscillospiraceae bacterium]
MAKTNSINKIIKRMTNKLGLPPCRIHDYRHTVATMLFDQGILLKDITLQLGHGQTSTMEKIYIKKTGITNDENVEALSRAIGI